VHLAILGRLVDVVNIVVTGSLNKALDGLVGGNAVGRVTVALDNVGAHLTKSRAGVVVSLLFVGRYILVRALGDGRQVVVLLVDDLETVLVLATVRRVTLETSCACLFESLFGRLYDMIIL